MNFLFMLCGGLLWWLLVLGLENKNFTAKKTTEMQGRMNIFNENKKYKARMKKNMNLPNPNTFFVS